MIEPEEILNKFGMPEPVPPADEYDPLPVTPLSKVGEFATTRLTTTKTLPIYTGVLTVMVGTGESGKSLLAAASVLDAIRRGETAIVLDGEMSAEVWRQRLLELGATSFELDNILYLPMRTPGALNANRVITTCRTHNAQIVLWDAALSVLARNGAKSENDNIEVQRTYEAALLGVIHNDLDVPIAGILIDHTSAGGTTSKSRGATAKFNDIDMLYGITLDDDQQPSFTDPWTFTVTVEKDRYALLDSRHDWNGTWTPLGNRGLSVDLIRSVEATNRLTGRRRDARDYEAEIRAMDPAPTSANEVERRLKEAGKGGARKRIQDAFKRVTDDRD